MGTSYGIRTYFAVETSMNTFFLDTGEHVRICSKDTSHEVGGTAKFCPECGTKITSQSITEATPVFKAFCAKYGVAPEEAFNLLREGEWEWSDGHDVRYTLGWFRVQAFGHDYVKAQDLTWALGVRLSDWSPHTQATETLAYSVQDMEKLSEALHEVSAAFGIETTPKLYIQMTVF